MPCVEYLPSPVPPKPPPFLLLLISFFIILFYFIIYLPIYYFHHDGNEVSYTVYLPVGLSGLTMTAASSNTRLISALADLTASAVEPSMYRYSFLSPIPAVFPGCINLPSVTAFRDVGGGRGRREVGEGRVWRG